MSEKNKYVVIDENILGCVRPIQPTVVQILATTKGATCSWVDGTCSLPSSNVRPAKRSDFDVFRVRTEGHWEEYYGFLPEK
jgi:uncharacterized ParB-like nuclease family protein